MYQSAIGASRHSLADTSVLFLVDADDPALPGYQNHGLPLHVMPERLGYVGSLNAVASKIWDDDCIIGAFGDDVLFRTPGWDRRVSIALRSPGIAYGDDLIHGKKHPSAVFMSSPIARALGWLALPATTHQWADDGWKRLGQVTDTLRFMPDVIVEHMHPGVNKAEFDDTYRSVFDEERAKRDYEGFTAWSTNGGLEADALKVLSVL
jgi:hypothetical protein